MTDILTKEQVQFMRENGKFGVLPEELKELCDNVDYLRAKCAALERLRNDAEFHDHINLEEDQGDSGKCPTCDALDAYAAAEAKGFKSEVRYSGQCQHHQPIGQSCHECGR